MEVTFAVPDLNWAASVVLSYGGVVMEPQVVRDVVQQRAAHIAALHGADPGKLGEQPAGPPFATYYNMDKGG